MGSGRVFTGILLLTALSPASAGAQEFLPAATSPERLALPASGMVSGDFNGDGRDDIAHRGSGAAPNAVVVLLAGERGDFAEAPGSPEQLPNGVDGYVVGELATGDFNGDGKLDIAAEQDYPTGFTEPDKVTILVNDGAGDFAVAPGSPKSMGQAWGLEIAAADFNNDSRTDVLTYEDNEVRVLLSDASGNVAFAADTEYAYCYGNGDAAVGDINEDGKMDGVVTDDEACGPGIQGGLNRMLGTGDGGFAGGGYQVIHEQADRGGDLRVVEANGDGHLDLLHTGFTDEGPPYTGTYVLLGDGQDHFAKSPHGPLRDPIQGAGLLNGDTVSDLIVASGSCVRIHSGQPSGQFAPQAETYVTGAATSNAITGDFDADGDRDLAAAWTNPGEPAGLTVVLNQRVPNIGTGGRHACDANGNPLPAEAAPSGSGQPGQPGPPAGGTAPTGETPPTSGGNPPAGEPQVIGPAGNPLGLPSARRCVDTRKWKFKLHHAKGARIVNVEVFVNGKRKLRKKGSNITRLTLTKLPQKKFKVRIVATQNTGSQLISERTYKGCKKSRATTRRGGRRR